MSSVTESDREMAQRIRDKFYDDRINRNHQAEEILFENIATAIVAVREEGHIAGLRHAEEICVARMLNDDAQLTFVDDIREEINRRAKS